MTQQIVNIGAAPDDGTGDQLRVAFDKCNDNFTELYESGAGTSTEGIWNFNQSSIDTTTAPTSGRFRTNTGTAATCTQFAIHRISINGVDRAFTLRTQIAGDIIKMQDKANADSWARFIVQAAPVDNGTWFQINVLFDGGGGTPPGNNQEIVFGFTASSGSAAAGAPVGAEYITSTVDATLTAERVLTDTATVTWDRATAGQIKANAAGGAGQLVVPQGRLTLQTATPVMTTTQAAKTTIFYSPYQGNLVPIYNGTVMTMTTFTELSVAITDTTKSPAAIGASKVNDWFVWNDAGTLRIGHGPDWTDDVTRSVGTALVRINGIWLNNAAITNGPAAQRGTYVGTTRSNTSSQLDWIYGTSAAGGGAAFLGVWNCYNRVDVTTLVQETTANWVPANAVCRPFNNQTGNRASAVFGIQEDAIFVTGVATGRSAANHINVGVGFNSTTTLSGTITSTNPGGINSGLFGQVNMLAPLGFNFWQFLEYCSSSDGVMFGNLTIGALINASGLTFKARM